MHLTSIVFLAKTAIRLVAGGVVTAYSGTGGFVKISVVVTQKHAYDPSQGCKVSWLRSRKPSGDQAQYEEYTFDDSTGFGYYVDNSHKLYRRPEPLKHDWKFREIKDHLYAVRNVVENLTSTNEEPVFCFRWKPPLEHVFTQICLADDISGQTSGSAPAGGDASVAGAGQGAQGVETRRRGGTRGHGSGRGGSLGMEQFINALPFEPPSRTAFSSDAHPVVPSTAMGLNPDAVAYVPVSSSGHSSHAPAYMPHGARGRPSGRGP